MLILEKPITKERIQLKESIFNQILRLQKGLISHSTGGKFEGGSDEYLKLRHEILSNSVLSDKAPAFLRRCNDLDQFWAFIKKERPTYQERREFIWDAFQKLTESSETNHSVPGDEFISASFERFGAISIQTDWKKALSRRSSDPEGAITAARTLIESVCKHILDDSRIAYKDADFPKLWALTAEQLNLMPAQHEHDAFKRILGNCQAVVDGLASIRNRVGDAHGKGRKPVAAKQRHAELAVNLAGAMASFLLATWLERPKLNP